MKHDELQTAAGLEWHRELCLNYTFGLSPGQHFCVGHDTLSRARIQESFYFSRFRDLVVAQFDAIVLRAVQIWVVPIEIYRQTTAATLTANAATMCRGVPTSSLLWMTTGVEKLSTCRRGLCVTPLHPLIEREKMRTDL